MASSICLDNKVRILIVDANEVNRSCMAAVLSDEAEFEIRSTADINELARYPVPDVIILSGAGRHRHSLKHDLRLAEAIWPDTAKVAIADLEGVEAMLVIVAAGADAILSTHEDFDGISHAIQLVRRRMTVLPGSVRDLLARTPEQAMMAGSEAAIEKSLDRNRSNVLTRRQQEVLQLLALGLSNKAIALRLAISESTVKVHIRAIMAHSGVVNRTQIVAHYLGRALGT